MNIVGEAWGGTAAPDQGRLTRGRRRIPALVTLLALLVGASVTPLAGTAAQALTARERTADERLLEQRLFEHHLTARSDPGTYGHGVMDPQPPLRWADDVAVVARAWSDEMARTRVFEHNPHFSSQTCCWRRIGENIVMGGPGYLDAFTVEEVADRFMQLWMDSDGHRRNLMGSSHEHIALGASIASDGAVYVTAVLRSPTRDAPPCSPTYPVLAGSEQTLPSDPEPEPERQPEPEPEPERQPEPEPEPERQPEPEPEPEREPGPEPGPEPDLEPDLEPEPASDPEDERDPEPHPVFSDIIGSTHAAAILAVIDAGIANGYPDGTYRPDHPVTRGQMATFLSNALDLEPSAPAFHDAIGTTHAPAIGAITAEGIAGGYLDGTYRPDHPVTRGQMATFLSNALDLAPS